MCGNEKKKIVMIFFPSKTIKEYKSHSYPIHRNYKECLEEKKYENVFSFC